MVIPMKIPKSLKDNIPLNVGWVVLSFSFGYKTVSFISNHISNYEPIYIQNIKTRIPHIIKEIDNNNYAEVQFALNPGKTIEDFYKPYEGIIPDSTLGKLIEMSYSLEEEDLEGRVYNLLAPVVNGSVKIPLDMGEVIIY